MRPATSNLESTPAAAKCVPSLRGAVELDAASSLPLSGRGQLLPAVRLLERPAGERRHVAADQLAAAIAEHRVERRVRDLDDAVLVDHRDAFEHRLDHARLRGDGALGADLLGGLGSDQRQRDDPLLASGSG